MPHFGTFSPRFLVLALASGFLIAASVASAQMNLSCSMTMDMPPDTAAPEKLPTPLPLTGIGDVRFPITSSKPETQQWFTQGLNLLYDFWDYESARAFEQTVRLDPHCAICYWGLYQAEAFRGTVNKAYAEAALDRAKALESHAGREEKLYIDAALAHEAAMKAASGHEDEPDRSAERKIWRKTVRLYPKDTNARLFLAESLTDGYTKDGTPNSGQKEAGRIIQGVLKQEPRNSGANHYWIHAVEAGQHPEQAIHSAEILSSLAPASGHMVHMPGHIFYRTGDYARAQAAFSASTAADERYMAVQHIPVDDDWNYVHNLMYSTANLLEQGKLAEAEQVAAKVSGARGHGEATLYVQSTRDSISRVDPQLPVALRTGDYRRITALLQAAKPLPAALPHLQFLRDGLLEFAEGMVGIEEHQAAQAEAASQRLDASLWRLSQQITEAEHTDAANKKKNDKAASQKNKPVSQDALPKPILATLSIMSLELRGALAIAQNRTADARKLFDSVQAEETDLGYREPPTYIRPVGETEAAVLLSANKYADAQAAYERALKERPNSGFPLYGLAEVKEHAGDTRAAITAYERFLSAWKDADANLPQIGHAHTFVAEHTKSVAHR